MKKILFVNDELSTGGVSSVLLNLLNALDKEKYDIYLLILNKHNKDYSYLPKYIHTLETSSFFDVCDITFKQCLHEGLAKSIKKVSFFVLIKTGLINWKIKEVRDKMHLPKFDVEVAFKEGISSIFVANSNCRKKINWIHSDYKVMNYSKNYMRTMVDTFRKFDINVAVSKVAMESFKEIFKVDNIVTVHNILNVERIKSKMNDIVNINNNGNLKLISVGRLHPQKSYDRLLNVVKRLNDDGYVFDLDIIGDGLLREELFKQKEELQLFNVNFLLEKDNPFPYIKNADLFVLSSIYEGLPTVVYESLICGVPVITTRVAGVDEQINDYNGIIVENSEEGLYRGIKEVLDDTSRIEYMKRNLKGYNYENESIIKKIDEIFS